MSLSFDLIADRKRRKERARRLQAAENSLFGLALACVGLCAFAVLAAFIFAQFFFP